MLFSLLLPLLTYSQILPSANDFLITDLPLYNGSFNSIPFKQYSGYMPLGDVDESAYFFWLVLSQNNPATDPVALWLNGGPGSSSIAFGFWTEHGPYRLQPEAAGVNPYEYSWNKIASMVYVESPSGVGFSYSNKSTGYNCTDEKSALNNYLFLKNFFIVFGDMFKTQDIYLTGESYGGHYIPQLANQLLTEKPTWLNRVKGFWIGNPGINSDWYYNVNEYAFLTYLWSHALLPQDAWVRVNRLCGWNEFLTDCNKDFTNPSVECRAAGIDAWQYVPNTWDPYDIYAPTCHQRGKYDDKKYKFGRLKNEDFVKQYTPWLEYKRIQYGINTTYVYNPCLNNWTPEYMNRADVLKAVHADTHYTREWPRHPVGWSYGSELADIALLFPTFFSQEPTWKIQVVSGDADSAVPFLGSQRWIECLGRTVKKDWFNWFLNQDVAGSVKIFDGITFQTIKECGHTIPTYCPEKGYVMWEQYLNGTFSS